MKKSALLLVIILGVGLFFAGFRYGSFVERLNGQYAGAAVTPTSELTQPEKMMPDTKDQPPTDISVESFEHKGCAISFLYPSTFKVTSNASTEARLTSKSETIDLTCNPAAVLTVKDFIGAASPSATVKVGPLSGKVYPTENKTTSILIGKTFISFPSKLTKLIVGTLAGI